MRNYERLEELSGTIAAGLQAGEVVLAVDLVLTGTPVGPDEEAALLAGGAILRLLADPAPTSGTRGRGAGRLTSTRSALDAVEAIRVVSSDRDLPGFAEWIADAIEHAAAGAPSDKDREPLRVALDVFSRLGSYELARANGMVRACEEPATWVSSTTTSRS